MSGLPREVLKWLLSLDLSFPIKNVRRDFSNGYLVAEMMSWYYDKEIQLPSYNNGTSLQTKLGNWKQLQKFFTKQKLAIANELVEGTIHCKPGAAIALLERIYVLLTNKELHYLPAKNRPNDFTDRDYQSQLPLYARSTTSQSIKCNLTATELQTQLDHSTTSQKAQTIIKNYKEQKQQQKQDFPERFEYSLGKTKACTGVGSGPASTGATINVADVPEVKVKQNLPPLAL